MIPMKVLRSKGIVKSFKRDTRKKANAGKPKNENAYKSCKVQMKKLLEKQTPETWANFKKAYEKLLGQNPTMATAFMRHVERELPVTKIQELKKP